MERRVEIGDPQARAELLDRLVRLARAGVEGHGETIRELLEGPAWGYADVAKPREGEVYVVRKRSASPLVFHLARQADGEWVTRACGPSEGPLAAREPWSGDRVGFVSFAEFVSQLARRLSGGGFWRPCRNCVWHCWDPESRTRSAESTMRRLVPHHPADRSWRTAGPLFGGGA